MDIAMLSMAVSQVKVQQQASISVMKMAMDNASQTTQALTEMMGQSASAMEHSVIPHLGGNIDISV